MKFDKEHAKKYLQNVLSTTSDNPIIISRYLVEDTFGEPPMHPIEYVALVNHNITSGRNPEDGCTGVKTPLELFTEFAKELGWDVQETWRIEVRLYRSRNGRDS